MHIVAIFFINKCYRSPSHLIALPCMSDSGPFVFQIQRQKFIVKKRRHVRSKWDVKIESLILCIDENVRSASGMRPILSQTAPHPIPRHIVLNGKKIDFGKVPLISRH